MQWGYGTWTSRHHLALEASNTLLDLADRADDRTARLMGHGLLDRVPCYLGDFIDGRDNIQQSLDLYDEEADASLALQYGQDPAMAGYGGLCWCLWMLGDFHGALAARDRTIQVAEATNHPQTLCYALGISSGWYGLRALEPAALRPWSGRFSALVESQNFWHWRGFADTIRGWVQARLGEPNEGLSLMLEGLQGMSAAGMVIGQPLIMTYAARVYQDLDRIEEGLNLIARAEGSLMKPESTWLYQNCAASRAHA